MAVMDPWRINAELAEDAEMDCAEAELDYAEQTGRFPMGRYSQERGVASTARPRRTPHCQLHRRRGILPAHCIGDAVSGSEGPAAQGRDAWAVVVVAKAQKKWEVGCGQVVAVPLAFGWLA